MRIKNVKSFSAIYFISLLPIFLVFEFNRKGDIFDYLQASSDLLGSENIFTKLYGTPPSLFCFGYPFLTILLYPFTLIPISIASLIWKLINVVALFRIFQLMDRHIFQPF